MADFVPSQMEYVKRDQARQKFNFHLPKADSTHKTATLAIQDRQVNIPQRNKPFDTPHVTPSRMVPDFLNKRLSIDAPGFCQGNPGTLQSVRYHNIAALGDACSLPNAKKAAARRTQIVSVAENLYPAKEGRALPNSREGHGTCPLSVEKGKADLAKCCFDGKWLLSSPTVDPSVSSRCTWLLKARVFPWPSWNIMTKGREWLIRSTAAG